MHLLLRVVFVACLFASAVTAQSLSLNTAVISFMNLLVDNAFSRVIDANTQCLLNLQFCFPSLFVFFLNVHPDRFRSSLG